MPLAPFLKNSLNQTNLDVENSQPLGGPNSFPNYNHDQKYSPSNTYLDNYQEAASPNSSFGINNTTINNNNIFKNGTNLDVENDNPNGGPNRTNSSNIPSGIYSTPIVNNTTAATPVGGVLMNDNGTIYKSLLHQYLNKPGQRYEEQNHDPIPIPVKKSGFLSSLNLPDINLPDINLPNIDFAGAFNVGGG